MQRPVRRRRNSADFAFSRFVSDFWAGKYPSAENLDETLAWEWLVLSGEVMERTSDWPWELCKDLNIGQRARKLSGRTLWGRK